MHPTASTSPGRQVAWWSLIAAAVFVVALFTPFLSGDDASHSLADGDAEMVITYMLPAVVAAIAAIFGLMGRPIGSIVAAGAVGGLIGPSVYVLTFFHRQLDEVDALDVGSGYGFGFFALLVAAAAGLFALIGGLTASRDVVDGSRPHQALAALAAVSFVGVPLALLLPEDGLSVWDADDNAIKAAVIAWAVLSPLVGFVAALGRTRGGMALALGVAIGHLGLAAGLALGGVERSESVFAGPTVVMREPLYCGSVVASVVLCALALVLTPGVRDPLAAIDVEHAPRPAGVMAPPPIVDMSTTVVEGRWDEDPFGRHEQRWWDGHHWSERVADGGVETVDAPAWPSDDGPSLPPR